MAAISAIVGGIMAAASIAGTVTSMKQAHDQKKAAQAAQKSAPVYNEAAERKKSAIQEAEANRKRVLSETQTVQTSALGNTGITETKKKTLLGG